LIAVSLFGLAAIAWLGDLGGKRRWRISIDRLKPVGMSALGHVWTAPWQELSDVFAVLVGCGHVSGLLVRQVWPLALMLCADRVPNKNAHF